MAEPSLADLIAASGLPADTPLIALHVVEVDPVTWHTTKPLTAAGITTLGEAAMISDAGLLSITGFGARRLDALKAAVAGLRATETAEQPETGSQDDATSPDVSDAPVDARESQPMTDERRAEIRAMNVDSCSADAHYNPDVWALEAARKELLAEVDRLNTELRLAFGPRLRLEIEQVLDRALGTEEADGAGAGIVADVQLLADRLATAERRAEKAEAAAVSWRKSTDNAGLAILQISRELGEAQDRANAAEDTVRGAYRERSHLIAFLAALYPAVITYSDPANPTWPVIYLTTPEGQLSWHLAATDLDLYPGITIVDPGTVTWDGHTTEEKYARLARLAERWTELGAWDGLKEGERG
ncbi:hypothetical protein J5X84_36290 [Streptosporangiaceae bacterium NEAU-GS5]|nr:hypothetical protein [Streptosporangiaceae bacterium NEAU-GS5]